MASENVQIHNVDHCFQLVDFFLRIFMEQSPKLFYKESCSEKFSKIHRKTHVLESVFW